MNRVLREIKDLREDILHNSTLQSDENMNFQIANLREALLFFIYHRSDELPQNALSALDFNIDRIDNWFENEDAASSKLLVHQIAQTLFAIQEHLATNDWMVSQNKQQIER